VSGILHNVDAHVLVESEIGKGTTFSLFFPAVYETDLVELVEKTDFSTLSSTLKICVVDDEVDITYLLKEKLSNLGYVVHTFNNGLEAFTYIDKNPDYFDAIITDYGMSNMNGLELTNKVLEKRPDIPILICTGYSSKLKNPHDLPKGNVFLFKKPVGVDMLDMTIKKLFIGK
jgi:CheY-like chemotaxis protein